MVLLMNNVLFIVISLCFISNTVASSFLDWFDWASYADTDSAKSTKPNQEQIYVREGVTLISVPFEELSPEDKFLQEAERFSIVSPSGLDTCEHRVVVKIKSSCSDLTEEELAKLSIRLLNCQSEVSGRTQVTCTDEMTLKECTSPMDSETWNAYHIINNRARAVCYAVRQQQFRALSEMTVNKLMSSALKQLTTMDSLEELQRELNLLTADTVSSVKEGQQGLLDQNSGLRQAQMRVRDSITTNLKQLTKEKTLIQSTQHELETLSEKLSREFEEVESQLESQSEQHQNIHRKILSTLADITAKIDNVWNAIDDKSQQLLEQQDEIKKSIAETLENLKQINVSVTYLLGLVNQVKMEVDHKMTWATNTIGGDGASLLLVTQHILYLLVGVLVSLFLQLSVVCRLFLLIAVLSNIALVYHQQALGFLPLSAVVVGGWTAAVILPLCWYSLKKYRAGIIQGCEYTKKKVQDEGKEEEDQDQLSSKGSTRSESVVLNNNFSHRRPSFDDYGDEILSNDTNSLSSLKYRRSTSRTDSRSHSVCAAVCRNGQLCRSAPTPGHKFCRRHITH